MVKVSVIMPVLNGMPYFPDALKSVTGQSLRDIEVIVVDAGSSDGTVEFVRESAENDPRIHLISSDKKSFGYQQNIGIAAANGKYIGFCESDDTLSDGRLEKLYSAAEENGFPDSVKMNYVNHFSCGGKEYELPVRTLNDAPSNYGKVLPGIVSDTVFNTDISYWCGIYRKEFIDANDIKLNESPGAAFQDLGFLLQLVLNSKSTLYLDESGYRYRRDNPGASSHASLKGKYCAQELMFFLSLIKKKSFYNDHAVVCAFKREFGDFVSSYADNIAEGIDGQYSEMISALRESFVKYMDDLPGTLSVYYSEIPYLDLFVDDLDQFRKVICLKRDHDIENKKKILDFVKSNKKAVIFGKGETGNSVYAWLRVNGFDGSIVFCDNNKAKIDNSEVYSVSDSVDKYSDALFLITNKAYLIPMQKQLRELGVGLDRIVLCSGITPFNANMMIIED